MLPTRLPTSGPRQSWGDCLIEEQHFYGLGTHGIGKQKLTSREGYSEKLPNWFYWLTHLPGQVHTGVSWSLKWTVVFSWRKLNYWMPRSHISKWSALSVANRQLPCEVSQWPRCWERCACTHAISLWGPCAMISEITTRIEFKAAFPVIGLLMVKQQKERNTI